MAELMNVLCVLVLSLILLGAVAVWFLASIERCAQMTDAKLGRLVDKIDDELGKEDGR